jgi:iron complex outermembrane receptor protein
MVEDQEIDETHMSPRASLHYQLRPQHNFRISASKAFRSPSIVEKHREEVKRAYNVLADYYRLTDDSLKAEEMESVELAYYGSFFDGKVEIDWRTFHEDMNGGIDHVKWEVAHQNWSPSAIDDKVYFFTNSKHWRATGYDMQITWRPFSSTAIYLQHANVRVDAIRFTDWDDTVGEQRILKVPEHTSSLLISQKFGSGWSGSIMGYHQSYVDWRGGEEIKALDRYDLSVSKEVRLNQYQLRLDLKVDNVTNEVYLEYQKGNYLERTVYLSAALEW